MKGIIKSLLTKLVCETFIDNFNNRDSILENLYTMGYKGELSKESIKVFVKDVFKRNDVEKIKEFIEMMYFYEN